MTLYEDLLYRGLIQDISDEKLIDLLNNDKITFYIGTDPTADSMHIGHYSSFLISKRLANHGHKPLLLVGGATGLIGDPKPTEERDIISYEEVEKNIKGLTKQAEDIFGFEVVNNYDWTKDIGVLDFLRDYGKYFNVSYMLAKDKVKTRLDTGITYAEFSYMILQALDFMHLYENKNCILQVAGSDQWGNITAGIELTRRKLGKEIYGLVMPLITDSQGVKFGKTEGNALWLDINKTSSYELYQFLINLEDSMIIDYLKKLTFLSKEEIEEIELKHKKAPHLREAHITLAKEVITDLHGELEYENAKKVSEVLFKGDISNITKEQLDVAFNEADNFILDNININIVDLLVNEKIVTSRREAREFINNNAIYINDNLINDEEFMLDESLLLFNKYITLRRGKKRFFLGKVQ